jgi:hypothetical protein
MIRCRLLPFLLLAVTSLGATDIKSYQVRLDAAANDSATGTAEVQLSDCSPGRLNLPMGFNSIDGLRVDEAPKGLRLEQGPTNGQVLLHLDLPAGIAGESVVRFSFRVPKAFVRIEPGPGEKSSFPDGSRLFRHALVATQEGVLGSYRFELLFPPGSRAQSIREQLPKLGKAEVGPRVRLGKIDGRQNAVLQMSALRQGDDTSMALELVPERNSLGWLAVGLLLSGLYLFYFRDLVAKANPDSPSIPT